jgi:hypothetical protein
MGEQFGAMIQFGIYAPLAKMTAQDPAQPVKDEMGRIYQNAAQTIAEMEKNMQAAPKASQANFERALEATKKKQPPLRDPLNDLDKKDGNGKSQKKAALPNDEKILPQGTRELRVRAVYGRRFSSQDYMISPIKV